MNDGFLKQVNKVDSMTGDRYALVLHGDADPSKLGGTAVCGFSSTGMVGVIAAAVFI